MGKKDRIIFVFFSSPYDFIDSRRSFSLAQGEDITDQLADLIVLQLVGNERIEGLSVTAAPSSLMTLKNGNLSADGRLIPFFSLATLIMAQ